VRAAGMQWVETNPARAAQASAQISQNAAPVRAGREPRPQAPVASAALQQVETRQ